MLAEDFAAGRQRSFLELATAWLRQPSIDLPAELSPILAAHSRLGTDANGTPLLSERRVFFADAKLAPGLEDFVTECFDALDSEAAKVRRKQIEDMTADRD